MLIMLKWVQREVLMEECQALSLTIQALVDTHINSIMFQLLVSTRVMTQLVRTLKRAL